ncbi:hypothetical protein BLA60_38920 [Actinophytocola xinjiangensis]|uniref:Riboflavin biosynthesis intermediates N-glycosidase n=1 Tax=Actinophytocola xinjiangensis TaxID=485602 RepID=A0A7Z1AU99_9PSEU|nr:NADAR family protein [Actinophytocola xinjiangensis]OLF04823.1 hypothetical protein BLA60_38920 [Actinophytocola xinjiangensis]
MGRRRTWRVVDGERVEGTWRPAFIHNIDTYYLTDLVVYADGLVDCWGLVTVDELAEKLAEGWVATDLPEGALASADGIGAWRFDRSWSTLTARRLLGEVRDEIDQLNDRPDSTARCLAVLDVFRADPTEANRAALRRAFEAIPEHRRRYALGDMDLRDRPLRILAAGPGNPVLPDADGSEEPETVTEELHAEALADIADLTADLDRRERPPAEPAETSVLISETHFPRGWPADAGVLVLRNEFPAPVTAGDRTYPTVAHAYWALAVAGEPARQEVLAAANGYAAAHAGERAPAHPGWNQRRTAVMADLLRHKFAQHPDLATALLATGTSRLIYATGDPFWGQLGDRGHNWLGRLLELVRAELAVSAT